MYIRLTPSGCCPVEGLGALSPAQARALVAARDRAGSPASPTPTGGPGGSGTPEDPFRSGGPAPGTPGGFVGGRMPTPDEVRSGATIPLYDFGTGQQVTPDARPAPPPDAATEVPADGEGSPAGEPTLSFWQQHKTQILIGAGVLVAAVVAVGAYKAGKRRPNRRRGRRHNGLRWEQKAPRIWVAIAPVTFSDVYDRRQTRRVALRIDGREGPYRVDMTTGLGPFEAIDGGHGFTSLRDAKGRAGAWLADANAASTLQPSIATALHANRARAGSQIQHGLERDNPKRRQNATFSGPKRPGGHLHVRRARRRPRRGRPT